MRRGITVLTLLIVIVVLLGVVSLLLPAIANTKRAASRMSCANNLKFLGLGIHNYRDTFGHFPTGTVPDTTLSPDQRLSGFVTLLPYLEHGNLYAKFKLAEPWDSATNAKNVTAVGGCTGLGFTCPDWRQERGHTQASIAYPTGGDVSITNYVGMAGIGADAATRADDSPGIGMFGYDRTLKTEDVKDGLDNTIMLIETGYEVGPWMRGGPSTARGIELNGGQLTGEGLPFGGTHFRQSNVFRPPSGVAFHILLADASVRETKDTISPAVLAALATVAGGEEVPPP
ncbi:MAG: DUF1559 domain-containing protein [Planctomycetes bacterium]|nr:DUF1559 domain-containing protein [Planctomycetota bacterium]